MAKKPQGSRIEAVESFLKTEYPGFTSIGQLTKKQLTPSKKMEMEAWLVPFNETNGEFRTIAKQKYYLRKSLVGMEIWYCKANLVDVPKKEEAALF